MHVDPIIEPLLRSSKLPVYVEELSAFLIDEQKKRQAFYEGLTEDVKAEFIDGEIVFHSPAKKEHTQATGGLYRLLSLYVDVSKLGLVMVEKALVKLSRRDFEPDVCFFGNEKAKNIQKGTLFFPAPDLAVEVLSDSTEGVDRGIKFEDYALHGVSEYWIVDVEEEIIEQYFLKGDAYILHLKVNDGSISSKAVKGFTIPVRAVFDTDENVAAAQRLLRK